MHPANEIRNIGNERNCGTSDGDVFGSCGMRRNRQMLFFQAFKMKRDGLANIFLNIAFRFSRSDTAREIGTIRGEVPLRFLNDDKIFAHFNPACFRMLFNVPGGKSWPSWPAMVTKPGFELCLNWRWLPFVRAKNHPSSSMSLIASRTFTLSVPWNPENVNGKNVWNYSMSQSSVLDRPSE